MDFVAWLLAERPSDSLAVIDSRDAALTTQELTEKIDVLAAKLTLKPGDLVAVRVGHPLCTLLACLSIARRSAVFVPIHERSSDRFDAALARLAPRLMIDCQTSEPRYRELERATSVATEVAMVLPTSGSRGARKWVQLGRAGLQANISAIIDYLPVRQSPRTAIVLPFASSYSLVGQALVSLRAGACALLLADLSYPAEQLDAMVRLNATGLSSVPASLRMIASVALDRQERPALGYVASAGAPLDARTLNVVREAFPNARLWNQYGLTEASPRVSAVSDAEPAFAMGSVGRAVTGVTLCVRDPGGSPLPAGQQGELYVQGASIMLGYLGDAEGSAAALTLDGLRTGDLASVNADGYLFHHGRLDDLVKCAGERVSLTEVADLVREQPGVADVCIVAVDDALSGQRLVAFVVPSVGETLSALPAVLRKLLSPAKNPKRIVKLEALPLMNNGKIDMQNLRERAAESA